ncbi:hypothetical protein BST81_18345 [Leptolyngbya sp. 'hensonii']|uniref:DUF4079 domain-containing protein n=1 Tax=Leptolyngbya sp. 'hensonii' TaxID=1922337 RepID=UPI00094F9BFC|nr:DUF4079 domain-containing protein [Leptolyngbya sp. 'hensonii']OLP16948.1 hypothetical protein BST81_18345 [Leptolyngbya sp. 'hensonii']
MDIKDTLGLLHPAIAVLVIYPLIGIVLNRALQVRQRRLEQASAGKSNVPPVVGKEHVQIGRWLSGAVVGLALLGLAHPILFKMLKAQAWTTNPMRVMFVVIMFVATIASLVMLYSARSKLWRGVFATLTGMGLILIGSQPEIFRRGELQDLFKPGVAQEVFTSHYYIGIGAALLMVFSLATVQDIYQDRQNRWRNAHIILNSIALLLFIGQGITGARDLLEIPLSWQEPAVYRCDFVNKVCP